jgi:hypothetical protein
MGLGQTRITQGEKMATKSKTKPITPSPVHSEVLSMIKQNIDLASRLLPSAEVDQYSRGNSPGPVDQYSKGNSIARFQDVVDPAALASKANIAAKASSAKTRGGG